MGYLLRTRTQVLRFVNDSPIRKFEFKSFENLRSAIEASIIDDQYVEVTAIFAGSAGTKPSSIWETAKTYIVSVALVHWTGIPHRPGLRSYFPIGSDLAF
jgi:hypothetical protein